MDGRGRRHRMGGALPPFLPLSLSLYIYILNHNWKKKENILEIIAKIEEKKGQKEKRKSSSQCRRSQTSEGDGQKGGGGGGGALAGEPGRRGLRQATAAPALRVLCAPQQLRLAACPQRIVLSFTDYN